MEIRLFHFKYTWFKRVSKLVSVYHNIFSFHRKIKNCFQIIVCSRKNFRKLLKNFFSFGLQKFAKEWKQVKCIDETFSRRLDPCQEREKRHELQFVKCINLVFAERKFCFLLKIVKVHRTAKLGSNERLLCLKSIKIYSSEERKYLSFALQRRANEYINKERKSWKIFM